MLEIQKYLRQHPVEQVTLDYGIDAKRHTQYPNLVLFKYNQINSPMGESIVQECRGLILDEAQDWAVVSFPYVKFFNSQEGHAADIDWSSARAYEKLDGSLMILYHYDGQWHVSSSGTPCATSTVHGFATTFGELFWELWASLKYEIPDDPNYCFMFEMMTPYNRIVCQYDRPRIVLHGVRNLQNFKEEEPAPFADKFSWECVNFYTWGDLDAVKDQAAQLDPMKGEGFIIRDAAFNRVKVKSEAYVALHHMHDNVSEKALLEIIRMGEKSELLSYFPEYRSIYEILETAYNTFCEMVWDTYQEIAHLEIQKDFALEATKHSYAWLLFNLRAKKFANVKENLAVVQIDKLQEALRKVKLLEEKLVLIEEPNLE